jgi:hypothetical protein
MESEEVGKMDSSEAAAALAGVSGAEHRLADQIGPCPPWRHAAIGFVMALLVGGASLSFPMQTASLVVGMALVALIAQYDRRRYGVFINGYRRGKTLPLTLALLGGVLVLMFAAIHARDAGLSLWTKAGITALTFAYAVAGSVIWQRVFLAELRTRHP